MESCLRFLGHLTLLCCLLHLTKAGLPVFQDYSPGPIKEGLPPGTYYYTFVATGDTPVTYSLDSVASEWFTINATSGVTTVKKTIDREVMEYPFRYKVFATDNASLKGKADVIQQIRDVNDNPPVFNNLPKTINIKEDSPVGSTVFTVSATDADATSPANVFELTLETGNEEGIFELPDATDGKIIQKKALDYDKSARQFVLKIMAKNTLSSPYLNATAVLTINVQDLDDLPAIFEKGLYEATIVKDSIPGTVVATVHAKDGDSFNATVEYKISPATNPGNAYKIDNNTGVITVNGPLTTGTQLLVATATSAKHLPTFTVVRVTVVSMLNASYTVTVPEGQSNVVIFDLEPAEKLNNITGGTFSIISGAQSGLFTIDGKNVKVGATALDRETRDQYQLQIALDKNGTRKGVVMVTILVLDVNDNSPSFQGSIPYVANIKEDAGVGANIVKIHATDGDSGVNGTVKYAITGGNDLGSFSMDNTTGQISLSGVLDRETTAQYTLTIQAYDGGSPPMTNTTTVIINVRDVNDNSPVINQTFFTKTLSEWAANGTEVVVISATDADSGDNGRITYVIQEGADGKFVIDPNSGVITTTGGLSYATKPKYTIIVKARDSGSSPRSATAVVSVSVEPKTNKTYTVQVTENRANEIVMSLLVVEQDYNVTGASLSISAGNSDGHFEIAGKDLKVGTKPLDREIKDEYKLLVTLVKDGKVRGVAMINVQVLDLNDNSPVFQSLPDNVDVNEDETIGKIILKVTATDSDSGANGTVKYAITAGDSKGRFSIDNTTGQISLSSSLDRETTAQYTLTIQAYDGGSPPMTNTTTVIINVQDVNDNSPIFTSRITNVTASENTAADVQIAQVTATDSDIGENSRISYRIMEGSFGKFVINETTGAIKTTGGLSFKERSKYTLIIDAMDNGTSPRSGSALVYIIITSAGVNQYKPVFTKNEYLGGVYKDTSDQQLILTVSAIDADSGTNGEVTYKLNTYEDNPDKSYFYLETDSGRLRSANSFVEKEGQLFILKAVAKDKGSSPEKSSEEANLCVFVLQDSHSMVITAGVSQDYILKNIDEFRGVLDDLTEGKAFIKSVRPGESGSSEITFNAVKDKKELTSAQIKTSLESKKKDIDEGGKYEKWKIQTYEPPKTGKRISQGGLSAIVGAMICLALLIGIGGIIMIVILIKKRRERERIRKNARVTFSDEAHYINIDGNMPVSKMKQVESAQEAHEGFASMADETSSVGSEEVQTSPDVMNYFNDAYLHDDHEEHDQDDGFNNNSDRVNFGTFFPPPPTEPPPPVPDSDAGDSLASEEESINSDENDPDYINAVLPPHEDFADDGHPQVNGDLPNHFVDNTIPQGNGDSPTHTDSTQLINPSSYKDTLLHDTTFGFDALRRSSNPELTTEL